MTHDDDLRVPFRSASSQRHAVHVPLLDQTRSNITDDDINDGIS
jgi:hypothetical protein